MNYFYQPETTLNPPDKGTVAGQSHSIGLRHHEPIIVMLDCLIRYAKAHAGKYGSPLSEDHVLGDAWLDTIKALHGLLDGDGAIAMEMNRSTDSKCNGACEALYWQAIKIAGFAESDAV